jgi:cbb3-type cytochrome oxidase subunit 1
MEWFVKAFLKASLVWLALGVTLGVAMAAHPEWTIYRLAHVHMVLLGFVTMMIYGVAYHVVPRFAGFPLHNRRAAGWHWGVANVGLAAMAAGFCLSAAGAYIFVYLLWRTIDGPPAMRAAARRAREAMMTPRAATLPVAHTVEGGRVTQA